MHAQVLHEWGGEVRYETVARPSVVAGEVLIDQCHRDPFDAHMLIYPILFCYRHALEISLKWIVQQYGRLGRYQKGWLFGFDGPDVDAIRRHLQGLYSLQAVLAILINIVGFVRSPSALVMRSFWRSAYELFRLRHLDPRGVPDCSWSGK